MKKNKIVIISIILLIIILVIISMPKSVKANIFFGANSCIEDIHICATDMCKQRCMICFKNFNGSSSLLLCNTCASELGRCSVCGKIEK